MKQPIKPTPRYKNKRSSTGQILPEESDGIPKRVNQLMHEILGGENVAEFARRCGMGESTLRNILNGALPRADKLKKIADAGGVSVDWLLSGKGNKYFESMSDAAEYARTNQKMARLEEVQWKIAKEALKTIDPHWMITLPGEPDDPLDQFVKDYNDKKIFPERDGLYKSIDKISIQEIKSWGKKALARKRTNSEEVTEATAGNAPSTGRVSAPEARAAFERPERRGIDYGRRADDFRNAPLEQFIKVPRFDIHAAAGAGPVIHSEQIVDVCAFKPEWVQHTLGVAPRDIALISVKGDGMAPTLSSGDMVLVDTHRGRVEDNAMYVLRHDDGDLRVKRIHRKLDGGLVVMNDNKEYPDDVFSPSEAARLNVVGRVVWRGCRM